MASASYKTGAVNAWVDEPGSNRLTSPVMMIFYASAKPHRTDDGSPWTPPIGRFLGDRAPIMTKISWRSLHLSGTARASYGVNGSEAPDRA